MSYQFSVDIYAKRTGMLWEKQHNDNTPFVEMRPSELIKVTNVKC